MSGCEFETVWRDDDLLEKGSMIGRCIERSGFAHVPNFLTGSELDVLRDAFDSSGSDEKSKVVRWFGRPKLPSSTISKLRRLHEVSLPGTRLATVGAFYFRVNADSECASVDFPWHVDHESWYLYGEHRRYLNIWLAVEKTDPGAANLKVIPHDTLRQADAQIANLVEGHGAIRVASGRITFDAMSRSLDLGFDLDELSVTPQMRPGDALVLRGDVLHRTQDRLGDRTALSLRCVALDHVIDVSHYYPSSRAHITGLLAEVRPYAANAFLFQKEGATRLSIEELFHSAKKLAAQAVNGTTHLEFREFLWNYQTSLRGQLVQTE